jgi:hypothetical protein
MKHLVLAGFLLLTIGLFSVGNAAPTGGSPAEVTNALYKTAMKNFGFSVDTIKAEKPWLAPDLYSHMMKEAKKPVAKGDAPDIEGDVFLNSQEDIDSFKVGKETIDQRTAKVEVTVKVGGEKKQYIVLLKQVDGAWKVSDVNYGGKDGSLTDLLK